MMLIEMTTLLLLGYCVLLCTVLNASADVDGQKCVKMEGRTDQPSTTLRRQLLCSYDKHTAPVNTSDDNRVAIEVGFRIRVHYKQSEPWESVDTNNVMENSPNWFTISAYLFSSWTDPRLKWDPKEHQNQTEVYFDTDEVWLPNIDIGKHHPIVSADHDGLVDYFFWTELSGNCWPVYYSWGDQRLCLLSFRFTDDVAKLIRGDEDYDSLVSNYATWSLVKLGRLFPLKKGETNEHFENIHKEKYWKYGPGYFQMMYVMQKNFSVQDAAIFAPAAVLIILLLSTTWIPAENVSRVAMMSMIVMVQVFMFHQSCRSMPFLPEKIVDIVRLYKDLIICTGVAVLEWLIAYSIVTRRSKIAEKVETHLLTSPSVFTLIKTVFVIPEKGSRSSEMAALLDRITFLLLTVTSFILLVLSKRPQLVLLQEDN